MKLVSLFLLLVLEIVAAQEASLVPPEWNSSLLTVAGAIKEFPSCSNEDKKCTSYQNSTCWNDTLCHELSCQCDSWFVPDTNSGSLKCLPIARRVNDPCNIDEQCTNKLVDTECTSGRCTCIPGTYHSQSSGGCLRHRKIGEKCENKEECDAVITGAVCSEWDSKTCKCPDGKYPNLQSNSCFAMPLLVGQPCEDNGPQCGAIENSMCLEGHGCQCKDNHIPVMFHDWEQWGGQEYHKCMPLQTSLHGKCSITEQCNQTISNSDCFEVAQGSKRQSTCQCVAGFTESHFTPGLCLQIQHNFNDPCEEDIQCTPGNITGNVGCNENKRCHCKPGSTAAWNHASSACLRMVPLGQNCSGDSLCVDASGSSFGTICDKQTNTCTCDLPSVIDGVCSQKKKLGDWCVSSEECINSISDKAVCQTGTCSCDIGYLVDESDPNVCVEASLADGAFCWESWQCQSKFCDTQGLCSTKDEEDEEGFWSNGYRAYLIYGGITLVGLVVLGWVVFMVVRMVRQQRGGLFLFRGSRRNATLFTNEEDDSSQHGGVENQVDVVEKF